MPTILPAKLDHLDFCDRVCSPAETVSRIHPRFLEFGITRLARLTGLDCVGIPVWAAIRPNSATLASSQGKGVNDDAAAASAVMEAVEIACAETMRVPARLASARDLAKGGEEAWLLPELLLQDADPVGEEEVLSWLEGRGLRTGGPVWVPLEAVGLMHGVAPGRYWQSTDGLASGNVQEEAVFHGLCERIERDALMLWRVRTDAFIQARCFDGRGLGSPVLDLLIDRIERRGGFLRLFDITSDIGVPVCFATLSPRPDGREETWTHFDLASGSGCHADFAQSAIRAVTEAAQTRLTTIAASRDDFDPALYRQRLDEDLLVYLRAEPGWCPQVHTELPARRSERLRTILDRLEAAGAGPVAAVPLTPPEECFAVVKVVAPGLENPQGPRCFPHGERLRRAAAEAL